MFEFISEHQELNLQLGALHSKLNQMIITSSSQFHDDAYGDALPHTDSRTGSVRIPFATHEGCPLNGRPFYL